MSQTRAYYVVLAAFLIAILVLGLIMEDAEAFRISRRTRTRTITRTTTSTSTTSSTTTSQYSDTFPAVNPLILGTCPPEVHDRYYVIGPDGRKYRTWHPVTVPIDPKDPSKGTCTFAHEHGDNPRQGQFRDLPPFGYAAKVAGMVEEIAAHAGFKVFYKRMSGNGLGNYAEWRIVVHQGTAGARRLVQSFHSIQIDVVDSAGRVTKVSLMAPTGELNPKCGPRVGDRIIPDEECVRRGLFYEVWYFTVRVGEGTVNGAKFFAAPGIAVYNPMTYMKIGDLSKVYPICSVVEGLPFGDPRSFFLGNMRAVEHPDFGWGNPGSAEFWTDAFGRETTGSCDHTRCIRQRVPTGYYAWFDDDSVFDWPWIDLPLGAPGGN
ncbi:hypothetical protein HRbin02_01189 [Candidatus Calditenuaceae archaeon HR02]|nr:hypothetical protein HRbin02_01189 [Candidatus Calditenuaceae archaeon HR02]